MEVLLFNFETDSTPLMREALKAGLSPGAQSASVVPGHTPEKEERISPSCLNLT
jgi:hypothetical protein